MKKVTPFLWFDGTAEEAATFYVALFKDARILEVSRRGPKGPVFIVRFTVAGQELLALNGGPTFKFTEAISLYVNCETQREVDRLWKKLSSDGGAEGQCGWVKDKYGLWWQIVPTILPKLLQDKDPAKAGRVTQAMLKMKRLNIKGLKAAYVGK
ncbi:MAG: VOC family protein [Chloroflexi bacterium]|nr:VOC family protein [Chloroflexota bacterium]